eukprot:9281984-Pyramimonas_sp.AAC.1
MLPPTKLCAAGPPLLDRLDGPCAPTRITLGRCGLLQAQGPCQTENPSTEKECPDLAAEVGVRACAAMA